MNSPEDGPVDPKHVEIRRYINKIEIVTSVGFYSILFFAVHYKDAIAVPPTRRKIALHFGYYSVFCFSYIRKVLTSRAPSTKHLFPLKFTVDRNGTPDRQATAVNSSFAL